MHPASFITLVNSHLKDDILRYIDPRADINRNFPVVICNLEYALEHYNKWGFCHGGHCRFAYPEKVNTLIEDEIAAEVSGVRPGQFLLVFCLSEYRLMQVITK